MKKQEVEDKSAVSLRAEECREESNSPILTYEAPDLRELGSLRQLIRGGGTAEPDDDGPTFRF